MLSGLEVLLSDPSRLSGLSVGLVCNHTAVTRELNHALPLLRAAGLNIVRVFGPEHPALAPTLTQMANIRLAAGDTEASFALRSDR